MNLEIKVTDSLSISYGNFTFVDEATKSPELMNKLFDLEQTLKHDYGEFARKYRMALEEFALSEETYRRITESGLPYDEQAIRERITKDVKRDSTSYPNLVTKLCILSGQNERFASYLQELYKAPARWNQSDYEEELERFVRSLFRFGSQNSHSGEKDEALIANYDICREYLGKLHHLLSIYYDSRKKFDGSRIPVEDYYLVPKKQCRDNGLFLPDKKYLYVRQGERGVEYYIFTNADTDLSNTQKRDIETIHHLWMDNLDTPQNIITSARFLSNKNGRDYRYWASPLPSFPRSLTDDYIDSLSIDNRRQIVHGIVRGVASMHHASPPFYHRVLSASAFIVCEVRSQPKVMLLNFDCAKDTDNSAEFSVLYAVGEKLSQEESPEFLFAPEVLSLRESENIEVDWEKADIFALAKTILKVIVNTYALPATKPDALSNEQYELICSMCSDNPQSRPEIAVVENLF